MMENKQTIAIFGASGNMGSAISRSLSKGPYRLLLLSNEPAKLQKLQADILETNTAAEVEIIESLVDARRAPDIIVLAVPYQAEAQIAPQIRVSGEHKIIISIANPINQTMTGTLISADTSAAEELQKLLPESTVVKAFNTTFAADFAQPVIDGKQVDSFIAGNDETAVNTVVEMIKTVGFNPIVAGKLEVSRTLENMQILLMQLTMKYNYNWLAGWKILHE